ncbi:MAG: type IV pilus twitching motility protein PilT [Candidatus Euphemobacter frigidus]|nr:type IV pilus twitching motility protein PilT [Candidatus Euphemobacter frigidus]MDP8275583.1 type IV pilus twitching motility protein PilT [Candidatus Euphemobacter frigidus]
MHLKEILELVVSKKASDLHITTGEPPIIRIDGELIRTDFPPLSADDTKSLIYGVLNDSQKVSFEKDLELDLSLYLPGLSRFRVNVHMQKGYVEAAFRTIPMEIPHIDTLGLPEVVKSLARKPTGLVLITGPTGTGKSTTMAAMIDLINRERSCLIIGTEDPIEYLHTNKKSVIKQREVGSDTHSFANALKHVLRQDPDVLMVGEMRDLETISTTITAAETGHLVISSLHTPDAAQTIDRLIDVFPPAQQKQIMIQLAGCLQGVMAQILLPMKSGAGRVVATEVMIGTPGVRNVIREHKTHQIPTQIQTGAQYGMHTMDQSLKELVLNEKVSYEEAIGHVKDMDSFRDIPEKFKEG